MTTIPSWAVRGAKVVCINATSGQGAWINDAPTVGAIYTVKRAFINHVGRAALHLEELARSPSACKRFGTEVGYRADRFRPLVTLSSDIAEHFEHLLDVPASHEREAEAA